MSDAMSRARNMYDTLCAVLDGHGWTGDRNSESMVVRFGLNTKDMPVHYTFVVDAERQLLKLYSPMEFKMRESKRTEGAVITAVASSCLRDGSFCYDPRTGGILYRLVASFRDGEFGEGMIHYFIDCTHAVVDHYNDKFAAVNDGTMTLQEFVQSE